MRHTIIVLVLAIAVVAVAQTGKDAAGQGSEATTKALIELENKCVDALAKSDTATLDSIFVDSYVDTDEQSHRSSKEEVLSVLKSGDLKIQSIKLSDMKVHVYGDAAVVTGSGTQVGNFKGQAIAAKVIFTDTFIKRNGKWMAVASHRSVAA